MNNQSILQTQKAALPRIKTVAKSTDIQSNSNISPLSCPSDEDELQGASRIVADPDSPTSRLMEQAARRSLTEANVGTPERRFSFLNDIARNPRLAEAARLELDAASNLSSPASTSAPNSNGKASSTLSRASSSGMACFQHTAEIDRQRAMIDGLDKNAEQESRINQGMANVMLKRLESARIAAERVLSVVQAFASAEAAYARAMSTIAGISLPGDTDGPSLRSALSSFSELPQGLGAVHGRAAESLSPSIRSVQEAVGDLRSACTEIVHGAQTAQRTVELGRKSLKAALSAHRDACKAFDATFLDKQKTISRSRGVEADPWVAEGRLVEAQATLQAAQAHQRRYLAGAFRRVGELERRRIDATCAALSSFVSACHTSTTGRAAADGRNPPTGSPSFYLGIDKAASAATTALAGVDCEGDLEAFSAVATDSVKNGDVLSARQAEMVDHLWRELLGSAEIVRQGEMERFDALKNEWLSGYAVLTRAGFLHWFAAPKDGGPLSAWGHAGAPVHSMNLARCEFEQGEAPAWRLIEGSSSGLNGWLGGRGKSQTWRSQDIDVSMDWIADLRELLVMSR